MGAFHTRKDVDGSLALLPLWWGPEDLLEYFHLQYFFQETDEALRKKKKKKILEMMARSAYCSALQMWSASIN